MAGSCCSPTATSSASSPPATWASPPTRPGTCSSARPASRSSASSTNGPPSPSGTSRRAPAPTPPSPAPPAGAASPPLSSRAPAPDRTRGDRVPGRPGPGRGGDRRPGTDRARHDHRPRVGPGRVRPGRPAGPHLGATKPLPVEVVRFAWQATRSRLLTHLPTATLRPTPEGPPVITDEGHHLLDCTLPATTDLPTLAATLKLTLGVVEHGLFIDQADEVLVGHPDGSVQLLHR